MSRTVLIEADLSLQESTQGATEQALAPASTTLKPDKLTILQEARDQAVRQGLSLEARAES